MPESVNRRILMAARPEGAPAESDFELVETAVPAPGDGQVLCRTVYLSLDPYMRGRMNDAPSYTPPVQIGGVMDGGTVAEITWSPRRVSIPCGRPRRCDRSLITSPMNSSGVVISTLITGSMISGAALAMASLKANDPAILNAISEESTSWNWPSSSRTLKSTTG